VVVVTIQDVLPRAKFAELRRKGLSYAEIAERVGYSAGRVAWWGKQCLPEELRTNRAGGQVGGSNRWKSKSGVRSVLPVETFIEMRKAGMSYREIGEEIGYSDTAVAQYGVKVLPDELRSWRSAGTDVQRSPSGTELEVRRCDRCTMLHSEGNPLAVVEVERDGETVEEHWCALCRLEVGGIVLSEFFESGMAVEVGIYI
jgi:lambda repressor-like predicted transcriptional regulator